MARVVYDAAGGEGGGDGHAAAQAPEYAQVRKHRNNGSGGDDNAAAGPAAEHTYARLDSIHMRGQTTDSGASTDNDNDNGYSHLSSESATDSPPRTPPLGRRSPSDPLPCPPAPRRPQRRARYRPPTPDSPTMHREDALRTARSAFARALVRHDWFHGALSRTEAERRLSLAALARASHGGRSHCRGLFLVREKTWGDAYVVSVVRRMADAATVRCEHHLVERAPDGGVVVNGSVRLRFTTVLDFVKALEDVRDVSRCVSNRDEPLCRLPCRRVLFPPRQHSA